MHSCEDIVPVDHQASLLLPGFLERVPTTRILDAQPGLTAAANPLSGFRMVCFCVSELTLLGTPVSESARAMPGGARAFSADPHSQNPTDAKLQAKTQPR